MADQITRLTAELQALAAMAKQVQAQMSGLGNVGQGGAPTQQAFRPYEMQAAIIAAAAAGSSTRSAGVGLGIPPVSGGPSIDGLPAEGRAFFNQAFNFLKGFGGSTEAARVFAWSQSTGATFQGSIDLQRKYMKERYTNYARQGPIKELSRSFLDNEHSTLPSPLRIKYHGDHEFADIRGGRQINFMRNPSSWRQFAAAHNTPQYPTGLQAFAKPYVDMGRWVKNRFEVQSAAATKFSADWSRLNTNKLFNRGMMVWAASEMLDAAKGANTWGQFAADASERLSNVVAGAGYAKILMDGALNAKQLATTSAFARSLGMGRSLARAFAFGRGLSAGVGAAAIIMAGVNSVPTITKYAGMLWNKSGDPLDDEARKSTADAFKHVEKWGARGTWGMLLHDQTVDHLASGDRFLGMQLGDSGSMGRRFLSFFNLAKSEEELKKEATQVTAKRIQKSAEHYAEAERQAELGNVDEVHSQLGQVNSLLGVAGNVFDREKGTKAASWVQMFETQRMARRMYAATMNARAGSRTGD